MNRDKEGQRVFARLAQRMLQLLCPLFCLFFFRGAAGRPPREEVEVSLGAMGQLRGVVTHSKPYPNQNAPHFGRPIYMFRNIPYAEYSVAGQQRFTQSVMRTSPYSLPGEPAYDATRTGPLCEQSGINGRDLDAIFQMTLEEFLLTVLHLPGDGPLDMSWLIGLLLRVVEVITELPPGMLSPNRTIQAVAHDWLDIDLSMEEDCLHLAVSTPQLPSSAEKKAPMPVMFFVHGGGFSNGVQFKMGPERMMAWNDVVVVAINYRLAVLGFLCLDTDEAAGNMGMLDIVTALEWVHANIGHFGGDPNQITIFGQSAGSATIGHLMLSPETRGLFARGIGSSGSPLASWAFDPSPERHGRGIAAKAGCHPDSTLDELVACLRQLSAVEVSAAFVAYQEEERLNGGLGFGGTSPCGQTKGARKFYGAGQTPQSILFSGDYDPLPIFYGANKHEGSHVYATIVNEFLRPNGLDQDTEFLRYGIVPKMLDTCGISNYYALKEMVADAYFAEGQLGNLTAMLPGLWDFFSVFFIKAAGYEFVQANAAQGAPSYWYAFDYDKSDKSLFHLLFLTDKANVTRPGVSHADELLYVFDLEIPLVFCDISAIATDALDCLDDGLNALLCLTSPIGKFRTKWQDCLTGELNAEETAASAYMSRLWSNFAATGEPGFGLPAWSRERPAYIKVEAEVSIREDYTKEYHVALDES